MSEQVTIKELLELNEGIFTKMSDITLEATIKRAIKTREVKGSKDGRDYHFFSQFVVITDGTEAIGMDLVVGKAEDAFTENTKVKIEKAKTATYKDKDGKTWRKLTKGKVSLVEGATQKKKLEDKEKKPETTSSSKDDHYITFGPNDKVVTNPNVVVIKDMLIIRTAVAKSFIRSGKLFDKAKLEAEAWVKWIYGVTKPKDNPKTKKSKDNSKSKEGKENPGKKDEETTKPLSDTAKPIGDEAMGRIGRLYVEAYKGGMFKPGYELADWLEQNWKKKSLLTLSVEELKKAEKELTEMVKGKEN